MMSFKLSKEFSLLLCLSTLAEIFFDWKKLRPNFAPGQSSKSVVIFTEQTRLEKNLEKPKISIHFRPSKTKTFLFRTRRPKAWNLLVRTIKP